MALADELLRAEWHIEALNRLLTTGTWLVVMVPVHGETPREREKISAVCTGAVAAFETAFRAALDAGHMAAHRRGRWAYVIRRA